VKLAGLDHPKLLHFASLLHITRVQAIGHLELMWAYTATKTPQGNVGKWPDGALAMSCDWAGDPTEFVNALVAARLVDRDPVHRLIVHDWHEHAPSWVRANLGKAKLSFARVTAVSSDPASVPSSDATSAATSEASAEASTRARVSTSCHVTSRHVTPSQQSEPPPGNDQKGSSPELTEREHHERFEQIKAAYPKRPGRTDWITAEHHYRLRIADGDATHEELLDVVSKCAAYYRHTEEEGTKWVISPVTFFSGPDRPWLQTWDLPADKPTKRNGNGSSHQRRLTPGEIIEQAIRDGRTDEEIAALPELDLIPDIYRDIAHKREEIRSAEH